MEIKSERKLVRKRGGLSHSHIPMFTTCYFYYCVWERERKRILWMPRLCRCPRRTKPPRDGITDGCESPDMGAGTQTQVFQNNKYSEMLSHFYQSLRKTRTSRHNKADYGGIHRARWSPSVEERGHKPSAPTQKLSLIITHTHTHTN